MPVAHPQTQNAVETVSLVVHGQEWEWTGWREVDFTTLQRVLL